MFERFTDKALFTIFSARQEASEFGSPAIETDHLLAGVLSENGFHLDLFLPSAGSREDIRYEIKSHIIPSGRAKIDAEIQFSSSCVRVLASAVDEADKLGHQRVRVAHIALGLLREEDSFAAKLLRVHGVGIESLRARLTALPRQVDEHYGEANPSE
jgi:ATP-dependent Clp protease ATP-binding subunit ClpC